LGVPSDPRGFSLTFPFYDILKALGDVFQLKHSGKSSPMKKTVPFDALFSDITRQNCFIANVLNMFRFHDALNPSIHLAGLLFPGRKGQTCQAGTEESEHIFDNGYNPLKA
jgi:hypothetical protein